MTTNYPYNATLQPDPVNNTTIRYASLDTIKLRLGITTNQWDAAFTEAAVSAENAIDLYNGFALQCSENADAASKQLFEALIIDEERHFDEFDKQLDNIKRFGPSYLALQSFGNAAAEAPPAP